VGAGTAARSPGLVARYSGPGDTNLYAGFLTYNPGGALTADIWRSLNGAWTLLASAPVSSSSGTLRFDVIGTSLGLYLNGALAASAQDSMIAGPGSVGVRGYNPGISWTNFAANAVTGSSGASLPFADNFNRPDSPILGGPWVEDAGAIGVSGQQALAQAAGASVATLNGISAADVSVQATVSVGSGTAARSPGLVARYSGPGDTNLYAGFLTYNPGGSLTADIWRSLNGAWVQLASAPVGAAAGTLRFDVVGTSLNLYLNDLLAASATDGTITAPGSVGLRGYGAGVSWDDFAASAVTGSGASLPFNDNFNRADAPALGSPWAERVGAIGVSGQQAVAQAAGASVATLLGISAADLSVQAAVSVGAGTAARSPGLVARYGGPGDTNFYAGFLTYNPGGALTADIWRSVSGAWAHLASAPVSAASGTLRFDVQGTSLSLYFNGALAVSTTDGMITAPGSVGLRGYGAGVSWDDFAASALP
jgi:hypothetical protein